jgi:hypothetical protein
MKTITKSVQSGLLFVTTGAYATAPFGRKTRSTEVGNPT